MSDKFQNKYRISSARLQNWDYGANAMYFVTICSQNRECYFGEIVTTQTVGTPNLGVSTEPVATIRLSEIGKNANQYWVDIPNHFPFVELGEFIVMPNHVHGIIIINKINNCDGCDGRYAINRVSTETKTKISTNKIGGFAGDKNPMINDNVSRIIRWYKGRVSFESRKINADFAWQSRFYDHIIRNDESLHRISKYIRNNPLNWLNDKLHNTAT